MLGCARQRAIFRPSPKGARHRAVPCLGSGGTSTCHPKRSERSRGSPRAAKAGTRPLPRNEIPTRGRPGAVGVRQRNGISTRGSRGRRIGAHGNGIPTRGTPWAPWVAVEERYLDSWQASNATSRNTVPLRRAEGPRVCHESEYGTRGAAASPRSCHESKYRSPPLRAGRATQGGDGRERYVCQVRQPEPLCLPSATA